MQGYAQCLQDSLWVQPAAASESEEDRAGLVLRTLQLAALQPAPNLAHLLLGFDVHAGPQGASLTAATRWQPD